MEAGTRIGSYEIIAPIGAGGMGVVYRARHTVLDREVAIKILASNLMLSEQVRVRFRQEAYIQEQLKHPHIVPVIDFSEEHSALFMELMEGGTVNDKLIETPGPWPEEAVLALLNPVVDAIAYGHGRNVVHRDIKPENILLSSDGIPKVSDFGIAKILAGDSGITRTGAKLGTIPYMSPEQFKGRKDLGPEADVYALGMLAWRMLTGKLPFDDPDNIEAAFRHYQGEPPTPSIQTLAPQTSPNLVRLVDACLSIDPTQRPKDADVMQKLLGATEASSAPVEKVEEVVPKAVEVDRAAPMKPVPPSTSTSEKEDRDHLDSTEHKTKPRPPLLLLFLIGFVGYAIAFAAAGPKTAIIDDDIYSLVMIFIPFLLIGAARFRNEKPGLLHLTLTVLAMVGIGLIAESMEYIRQTVGLGAVELGLLFIILMPIGMIGAVRFRNGKPRLLLFTLAAFAVVGLAFIIDQTDEESPVLPGETLSVGGQHACALLEDKTIRCWGSNDYDQLYAPSGTFTSVSAGDRHSCAIHTDGTVKCWGYNGSSRLDASEGEFAAVSAGGSHTCALGFDNTITCWGYNGSRQIDVPKGKFIAISAGGWHTCALRTDKTIACWGDNYYDRVAPEGEFAAISAGGQHSCALRTDNTITCWGSNEYDQRDAPEGEFTAVSAGGWHTCALRTDKDIVCWGGKRRKPHYDMDSGEFVALSAGGARTCARRTDGSVYCWGELHDNFRVPERLRYPR